MSVATQEQFISALRAVQTMLEPMGFSLSESSQQGFGTWVSFEKTGITVEFACGPAEYHIEMFIRISTGSTTKTYDLADLIAIPSLGEWIREHRPVGVDGDNLLGETHWFAGLLSVALPRLEHSHAG